MSDVSGASAVTGHHRHLGSSDSPDRALFGGLKSDLSAPVGGLGHVFQQLFALKGSQSLKCFAVLVLEPVAVLNYVPVGCALELPSPFATKLHNVSHGVSGALPAACAVTSE